jgi:DNA-binding CsgD family transcriptional regulator/PAS domain-containing protein
MADVLKQIGMLYEASLNVDDFKAAIDNIVESMDGVASFWYVAHPTASEFFIFNDYLRFDPSFVEEYRREMWPQDYTLERARIADRTWETSDILPDDAAYARNDYACWLEDGSGSRHMIFRSVQQGDGLLTSIAFHTPRGAAPDETDRSRFEALHPHIFRSLELGGRLHQLMVQRDVMSAALETMGHGVILLDGSDRLLWCNATARRICNIGDGLVISRGTISTLRASETAALAQACSTVRRGFGIPDQPKGLPIPRSTGKRPYLVQVYAVPSQLIASFGSAASVMLLIHDPDAAPHAPAALWHQLWGVTPSQARLAAHLLSGFTLEQAADQIGIGRATAASHLKALFDRTGCRRQTDLIRLLSRLSG